METWYKFILYGTYDGFSRSTLGDDNLYLVLENGEKVEVPRCFVKNASDFIEKDKLKLKDVIARIKKLDLGAQEVWLNEILNELGSDYGTLKYKAGYEQGKVEGALIHCEEPQKITVPKFVADWIEYCKNTNVTLVRALLVENVELYNYANQKDYKKLKEFLRVKDNQEDFACAWLDGYEVAKEKRYIVKVKGAEEGYNYLNCRISLNEYFFSGESEPLDFRVKHTREMLEGSGFGWVFDCPGIEIEEAEE